MKNIRLVFIAIALQMCAISGRAEAVFSQPEFLSGGISGSDGRQIQVQISFVDSIKPSNSFSILVNDQVALSVQNNTKGDLTKFVTRLRMFRNEKLQVVTHIGEKKETFEFFPKVTKDYVPPMKDEYSLQAKVVLPTSNQLKATIGADVGDCAFLLLGVSNSGDAKPKTIELSNDLGTVVVTSSDRLSTNPLFVIGSKSPYKECSVKLSDMSGELRAR